MKIHLHDELVVKIHLHDEQFDGHPHSWCGVGDSSAVSSDTFEATPAADRCARCDKEWFPNGQPDWHFNYAVGAVSGEATAPSRVMFVARLENMQANGDRWLTVEAVLALLNDCDMLASRDCPTPVGPAQRPGPPTPKPAPGACWRGCSVARCWPAGAASRPRARPARSTGAKLVGAHLRTPS